jgi:hypothetical protein
MNTSKLYKARDNSFKRILDNHELFSEFLRDFVPIDCLKAVRPEDIEDLSERFLPLNQNNRDADTIKRINLKADVPLFVIAVVEHESHVNYRMSFKFLQYICLVLDSYEKEAEARDPGCTRRKGFRYPPVLPIVLYDGPNNWTAEKNFLYRTSLHGVFEQYIPRFEYLLVDLQRYKVKDIMDFSDALSLVMLVDRMETVEDIREMGTMLEGYAEKLRLKIPNSLTKLLKDVMEVLLMRRGLTEEAIQAVTEKLEEEEYKKMMEETVTILNFREWRGYQKGRKEAEQRYEVKQQKLIQKLKERGATDEEIEELLRGEEEPEREEWEWE